MTMMMMMVMITPALRAAIEKRQRLRQARDPGWVIVCQDVPDMTQTAKTKTVRDLLHS